MTTLRAMRLKLNLTQAGLAHELGCSLATVQRLERHEPRPRDRVYLLAVWALLAHKERAA